MPCYDPPPPFEGEERRNAEKAVKLLCSNVANKIDNGETVEIPLLEWFLEHKQIDLKVATDGRYGRNKEKDAEDAKRYIKIVKELTGYSEL